MKLYELIRLKAKYGTVYLVEEDNKLYVCREPTLAEVIAQEAVKNAYELTELDMYKELAKVTMVMPEDPDFENETAKSYVPDYVVEELQDQLAVDVPYNSRELEIRQNTRLTELVKKDIDIKTLATQIWMITGHNARLDIFYSLPLSTQIDMLALILFEQTLQNLPPEKAQELLEQLGLAEQTQSLTTTDTNTSMNINTNTKSPEELIKKMRDPEYIKKIEGLMQKALSNE